MSFKEGPSRTNKLTEIIAILGLLLADSGVGEDKSSTIEALTQLGQKQEHLHEITIKELEDTIEAFNKALDDFFETEGSLKKELRELTEKLKEDGPEYLEQDAIKKEGLIKRISEIDKSSRRLYELLQHYEKLLEEKTNALVNGTEELS